MLPIICMVGASNSGKTTYLEKLIPELRRRGYQVGTLKHDVHGFEMDREGRIPGGIAGLERKPSVSPLP